VVLGLDRQPLAVGDEARAVRHRPALEHAVELESEVVVNAAGGVLLHYELAALIGAERRTGLAGARGVALLLVDVQRTGWRRCRGRRRFARRSLARGFARFNWLRSSPRRRGPRGH